MTDERNFEAEAREMGWVPQEEFRGDAGLPFLDAQAFVEKNEHVLPILKKQKKDLQAREVQLRQALQAQQAETQGLVARMAAMEEDHADRTVAAVEAAVGAIKAQIAQASKDGDHEQVAELTDELVALRQTPPPPKQAAQVRQAANVVPPEVQAFAAENSWFGTDRRKTALFMGTVEDLRAGGDTSGMADLFTKAKGEMEKMLGGGAPPDDKAGGGRRSGGGGNAAGGFAGLPAEAQAAAKSMERQFVGKGKLYETPAAWHAAYAAQYTHADATNRRRNHG